MKLVHTMIRVLDLEKAVKFFNILGLKEIKRRDNEKGRFTLLYMAVEKGQEEVELTWNWDQTEPYSEGRNFGHIAFTVENIYEKCQELKDAGIIISRPPRDGHMAFIRTPDNIAIELIQEGDSLPLIEPWKSMENQGTF